MRYFHDEKSRTVWAIPPPRVFENKPKATKRNPYPARTGWSVWAEGGEVVSAEYWRDDTGKLVNTASWGAPLAHYSASDSEKAVIDFYTSKHLTMPGVAISQEEFERLKALYMSIAEANKPPSK